MLGTAFQGGLYGRGSIFSLTPDGSGGFVFSETYAFTGGADGNFPDSALVAGPDGSYYGVVSGGSLGSGLIFRVDASGNGFEILHEFASTEGSGPSAPLVLGSDGLLYGTTVSGGDFGAGTVYAFDAVANSLTVLHGFSFATGGFPRAAVVEALDGGLYGVTSTGGSSFAGVVYRLDKNGGNFAIIHELSSSEGSSPISALVQLGNGFLYGTASSGGSGFDGTVFKLDTAGGNFQVLHEFSGADGNSPQAALVLGSDGLLYGTTAVDSTNSGTIYRIDTAGTAFASVHTFSVDEGQFPAAALIQSSDGFFYGTTQYGAAGANGSVYRFDASSGDVDVVHSFLSNDGFRPVAALVRGPGGYLYGTTHDGGAGGFGTVFRMDSNGGSYQRLHDFDGTDGAYPGAPLLVGSDGVLYGTTSGGGTPTFFGNVFRLTADGSSFNVLHTFAISDGVQPLGGLIQATDGLLYGTTVNGGRFGNGVVFRLSTTGSSFALLHEFDQSGPEAGLVQASDGQLYGTTFGGGANGYGTVFKLNTSGSGFAVIHDFDHAGGASPAAALIQLPDGKLYGTTSSGTDAELGVVFSLETSGRRFTVLHAFDFTQGAFAYAPLIAGPDGLLYGTTFGGGDLGSGTVYHLMPSGSGFGLSHSFSGSDGSSPFAGLVRGSDGRLYGAARDGGALGGGTLFRLEPAAFSLSVTRSGNGSGTIVSAPAGINCGTTCSAAFANGSNVTLTANPASNSLFAGWSGDADCADGSLTMDGNKSCNAVFQLGPDLTILVLNGPASANRGQPLTLSDTTKNTGAAPVASSTTSFFLSTDQTLDGADIALGSRQVPALAAGATNAGSVVAIVPSVAPGNYYLIAVADATAARAETNEGNNTRARVLVIH